MTPPCHRNFTCEHPPTCECRMTAHLLREMGIEVSTRRAEKAVGSKVMVGEEGMPFPKAIEAAIEAGSVTRCPKAPHRCRFVPRPSPFPTPERCAELLEWALSIRRPR